MQDLRHRSVLKPAENGGALASPSRGDRPTDLTFGARELDAAFDAGGLVFGAHQIAGLPGEGASALLFGILMTARRFRADSSARGLVVQERGVVAETGGLYGPGLHALGLDPGRLAFVTARDGGEALRMVDEAVRSGAVAVVLAELDRGAARVDLSVTRRFNVAGRASSTLALLVTPDLSGTSAAVTRWRVRTAPSRAPRRHLGPPALDLELVRNRLGPVGRFTVEWNSDDVAFRTPAPLRAPVVRPAAHRPAALGPPRLAPRLGPWGGPPGGGGDLPERLAAGGGR